MPSHIVSYFKSGYDIAALHTLVYEQVDSSEKSRIMHNCIDGFENNIHNS